MLTVENFSVAFSVNTKPMLAIKNVDFSLAEGESLGIIGESGSGKTTLGLGIMGLLKKKEVAGRILFQGRNLLDASPVDLRRIRWRKIAMVFQNSLEVLNPVLTLAEQLTEPLVTHLDIESGEARDRVAEMLAATGLSPKWLAAYPHELSGGMRQRALIAMALACNPELLIVDEPTTSLDPESREEVLELLKRMHRRLGFALIMISHNLPAVRRLTGRLLTVYGGRIIEDGGTADVFRRPLHPYTRGLINAASDFFPYKDLWGIPGEPPRLGKNKGCGFAPRCCQAADICRAQVPELDRQDGTRWVACHKGGIETVLEAEGIKKTFHRGEKLVKALRGVSLTVRRGEVVALIGPSGSGKSTLARILVRVLEGDGGRTLFLGKPVNSREATATMGGMQLIYQDPGEAVSHRLTVLEAVREPLNILAVGDRKDRDLRATGALAAMHLPVSQDFLDQSCHSLSSGQRQRVAIARGLVTDPALLIADEITAMLDPSTRAVILRELKGLQHSRGFSMLFISHDLQLARKIADRAYVLDRGAIVEDGAVFEVLSGPQQAATSDEEKKVIRLWAY
jgi:peptide/nickel transport system ATP-binding protein